ncbi:MAG: hypothetical protein H0X33_09465 [Taibaiella sp.]|nr:hypothetical protein [Taibaiella sp.]
MIKGKAYFYLLLVTLLLVAACNQEKQPCAQPTIVSVKLGCYHLIADTNNVKIFGDTALPHPVLSVRDTAGVFIRYIYTQPPVNKFSINLSSVSDSTVWTITPDTTLLSILPPDTLVFHYLRQLTFISNSCGYSYNYNIRQVNTTHNSIDSVIIVNASVTSNANVEHLKIYIHHL